MSTTQEDSKEAVPCKSELKSKAKSVGVSAPSSPRTPSPAASVLTISSGTATEKSGKGCDEASFSGACLPDFSELHSSCACMSSCTWKQVCLFGQAWQLFVSAGLVGEELLLHNGKAIASMTMSSQQGCGNHVHVVIT